MLLATLLLLSLWREAGPETSPTELSSRTVNTPLHLLRRIDASLTTSSLAFVITTAVVSANIQVGKRAVGMNDFLSDICKTLMLITKIKQFFYYFFIRASPLIYGV